MDRLTVTEYLGLYSRLVSEQSDYLSEWRSLNDYLLPGRTLTLQTTKPRKLTFAPAKAVNAHASLALSVLASGFHGGLTSPARPWFSYTWPDERVKRIPQLTQWLDNSLAAMYDALARSNFYEVMRAGYSEFAAYGNLCIGLFEGNDKKPLQFTLLTVGEYVVIQSSDGEVICLMRQLFMTQAEIVKKWGTSASQSVRDGAKLAPHEYKPILHVVHECSSYKLPWISFYIEMGPNETLSVSGFEECPFFFAPWDTVGSDLYGTGPGSTALADIKRLQEIEKAFLMAAHKSLDPPISAPSHKRGKVNTLPGAVNYYRSATEKIEPLYDVKFDYQGAMTAVERIEQRLSRFFFNEVFLTATRDPNASPLKAAEVNVRNEEKLLRLGPVLERLHSMVLKPMLHRAFNILQRKGKIDELPPELQKIAETFDIEFVSILAKSQKLIETRTVSDTLQFVASIAAIKPDVLDMIDEDAAVREYADTVGTPLSIINSEEKVAGIRKARQEQMAQKQAQEQQMVAQQHSAQTSLAQSQTAQNYAGAGVDMKEVLGGQA